MIFVKTVSEMYNIVRENKNIAVCIQGEMQQSFSFLINVLFFTAFMILYFGYKMSQWREKCLIILHISKLL